MIHSDFFDIYYTYIVPTKFSRAEKAAINDNIHDVAVAHPDIGGLLHLQPM